MSRTVDLLKTFKKGDRVFDICYDWGTVERVTEDVMTVKFDNIKYMIPYTQITALTLSFTEYTLQGNSQERPVDWKNYMGKWGKFYDNDKNPLKCGFLISKLAFYEKGGEYPFRTPLREGYTVFEPLTKEQLKILGLE